MCICAHKRAFGTFAAPNDLALRGFSAMRCRLPRKGKAAGPLHPAAFPKSVFDAAPCLALHLLVDAAHCQLCCLDAQPLCDARHAVAASQLVAPHFAPRALPFERQPLAVACDVHLDALGVERLRQRSDFVPLAARACFGHGRGDRFPDVLLVAPCAARGYRQLSFRGLLRVDAAVALSLAHLREAPFRIHVADGVGVLDLRVLAAPFVEPPASLKVGAVDDHMDGVAVGAVCGAVLQMQHPCGLVGTVAAFDILPGVPHARLGRHSPPVAGAFVGIEGQHLMVGVRALCALLARGVVPVRLSRGVHLGGPPAFVGEVLACPGERALVVEVLRNVLPMAGVAYGLLLYRGHAETLV